MLEAEFLTVGQTQAFGVLPVNKAIAMALTMKRGDDRHCWSHAPPLESEKVMVPSYNCRPVGNEAEKTLRWSAADKD